MESWPETQTLTNRGRETWSSSAAEATAILMSSCSHNKMNHSYLESSGPSVRSLAGGIPGAEVCRVHTQVSESALPDAVQFVQRYHYLQPDLDRKQVRKGRKSCWVDQRFASVCLFTARFAFLAVASQLLVDASFHAKEDCSGELCQRTSRFQNGRRHRLHGRQSEFFFCLFCFLMHIAVRTAFPRPLQLFCTSKLTGIYWKHLQISVVLCRKNLEIKILEISLQFFWKTALEAQVL